MYRRASFWQRLNERTLSEMQIYERTHRELEKETRPRNLGTEKRSTPHFGLEDYPRPE